jgi:hypothetical protein
VVLSVIYDPLIALFREGTGEFDFEPDTVHWLGPFRAFPVDAIVGEVRKRVREVDEWSATIPSLSVFVEARRTLPGSAAQVTLLREDWELVTSLSGTRSITDLASDLGRGAYSTARVVHRLHQAGLVEVVSNDLDADVVPIRRLPADDVAPAEDIERDPLLDMGLPHRTHTSGDPLTDHIGDAIADALADSEPSATATIVEVTDAEPTEETDAGWDGLRRVEGDDHLHHDAVAPTSLDEPKAADPNAAWLADLYAQFIDDPEVNSNGKKRKKDTQALDVAFKAEEVEGEAKVSTLKRLIGALKKI